MRFLVDVNASGSLAELLIDLGHDVVLVRDKNPRMRDEEILNWAVAERRIIVTTDKCSGSDGIGVFLRMC